MTTNRKPMSGKGQDDYTKKLDTYNRDSRSKAVGNFMQTFSRTKTGQVILTWNDTDYFWIIMNTFSVLADASGAVDSATVGSAQFLAWLDDAWEMYYKNANLKDLVAADETSWKLYFCAAFFIKHGVQLMYNYRCYLPAYTEADSTPGSSSQIAYFSQESFDTFVASMKEYPMPKGVNELVDTFCTWVIEMFPPYERGTLRLPGMYVCPFNFIYDLEDLEAARDLLRVNWGGMETHAKKYGLPTEAWKDPVKPTVKQPNDVDVIAHFTHASFEIYGDAPASVNVYPDGNFQGSDLTNDYTNTEYIFKDTPNESKIHVLAPLYGTYNATNNKYGGWIIEQDAPNVLYKINALSVSQHGTSLTSHLATTVGAQTILKLFKAYHDGNSAAFQLFIDGTNLTAAQLQVGQWELASDNKCFKASGRRATVTNNDLINFLGRLIS